MGNPEVTQKSRTVLIIVLAALGGCMVACCGVGAILLPPAIQQAREAQRRQQAAENLRQIGIALQNYHEIHAGQTTVPAQAPANQEDAMLNPEFPVVEGTLQMTKSWSMTLPDKFNRRIEEGDLVLWRPGFTIWVSALNNDHDESEADRMAWLRDEMSPDAFDVEDVSDDNVVRLAYRLNEESEDQRVAAFYGFVVGANGHIQLAIYFDDEQDEHLARKIWLSVTEGAAEQS
jgi:hypothetical protein